MIIEHGLPALVALNKTDLPQQISDESTTAIGLDGSFVQTCAINDQGVEPLRAALLELVNADNIQAGEFPLVTNQRHREALRTAENHLGASNEAILEINQRYSKLLEEAVREYPQQYFWFHRKWARKNYKGLSRF